MERILFVVPPYVSYENYVNPLPSERIVSKKSGDDGSVVTYMPIGLLSLSAYLKKHSSVEVKLLDFNVILNKTDNFIYKSFSEMFLEVLSGKEWLDFDPTIIGISTLFTPAYHNMVAISEVARRAFPDAMMIAGGGVPTIMHREIFAVTSCFDALCYGEGERPLLGLVNAVDKRGFLNSHPSWITRGKSEAGFQFQYDFISDLDEIPFYDYKLLRVEDYGLSPTVNAYSSFDPDKKRIFHVATSRGCPHLCCFCASHKVHGRKMRYHTVDRVKEDITRLQKEYGAKTIGFQDDSFMINRKRALQIIQIARELKIKIFFNSGLALYALDQEMLEAIKSAGLDELVLAMESGSDRVLKEVMHKPINTAMIKRVIEDCRKLGINTDANILIGLPGETKQDIEDTRSFLRSIDVSWFCIYTAAPLVGSEMYDICVDKNYLKGSHIGSDFKRAVIETDEFTPEWIQEKVYLLNLELNFVENNDLRLGNYATALKGFENTIRVRADHALAYYYASKCYGKLGDVERASRYMGIAKQIVQRDHSWQRYASTFGIYELI